MGWKDRIALYFWRDRGGYDVETSGLTQDYNRSLLTRFRQWRYDKLGRVWSAVPWLVPALLGGIFTLAGAVIPLYLNAAKTQEQVKLNTGELLLSCIQEPNNVFRCRPVVGSKNKVIASSDGNGLNNNGAAKK